MIRRWPEPEIPVQGGRHVMPCRQVARFGNLAVAPDINFLQFANRTVALVAAFLVFLYLPWGFMPIGFSITYPYGIPAMMFCVSGLWMIATHRFGPLWILLIVGTLNRETMIWLVPAYLFYGGRARRAVFVPDARPGADRDAGGVSEG